MLSCGPLYEHVTIFIPILLLLLHISFTLLSLVEGLNEKADGGLATALVSCGIRETHS